MLIFVGLSQYRRNLIISAPDFRPATVRQLFSVVSPEPPKFKCPTIIINLFLAAAAENYIGRRKFSVSYCKSLSELRSFENHKLSTFHFLTWMWIGQAAACFNQIYEDISLYRSTAHFTRILNRFMLQGIYSKLCPAVAAPGILLDPTRQV